VLLLVLLNLSLLLLLPGLVVLEDPADLLDL
jgi:hypothetical protein